MYQVDGFLFDSKEMAQKAEKEKAGIKYIKEKTSMDNPDNVLGLYNKLLKDKIFETPVGMAFLVELQEYLHTIPYIKNEDIKPIYFSQGSSKKTAKTKKVKAMKNGNYKTRYRIAAFCAVVFAIVIVGMFGITYYSGNSVNILNYENQLIDKYENWEQELNSREADLNERERAFEEKNGQD